MAERPIGLRLPFRRPIFYGWFIVGAALVSQFAAVSTQASTAAVFLQPMTQDLGWSRADYTWAQTIGTFVMGGAGFVIGSMIDARGPRTFMLVGIALAGASVLALSQVQELWHYLVLRGFGMAIGALMFGNLVVNVTVSKWFVRNRGWAIALAAAGLSLSGAIMPRLAAPIITDYGWRTGWIFVGVVIVVLAIPAAFVMRRRPEDYGLVPDGGDGPAARPGGRTVVTAATEVQWSRREAMRTRALWLLVLAFACGAYGSGSLFLHLIPYMQDHGYSREDAASLFSLTLFTAVVAKVITGALVQRFHPRFCAAAGFLVCAAGCLGIVAALRSDDGTLLPFMLVVWALGFGGQPPLQELIWATYFGRRNIGQIRGVVMPMLVFSSAIGPQFAARIYDELGRYDAAFVVFALTWTAATVFVLAARPPRKQPKLEADLAVATAGAAT